VDQIPENKSYGITLRSFLIGLVLIPINSYWVVQSEAVWWGTYLTIVSLFFNVIFTLLVLIGINAIYKKFFPDSALKQAELITIYVMLSLGSGLAGNNFLEALVLTIGHPFWFATPENEWSDLFFQYVPDWLAIKDKTALRGFYEGESSIYDLQNLVIWSKPLIFWGSFAIVWVFTLLCVVILVRRQWTENEKLSYPIIQLPLAITRNGTASVLFKNRLFLFGFALTALLTLINGLHFHFPSVPNFRVRTEIGHLFTEKPWNAIGWLPLAIYPWVVGITLFIPLDLCFSVWFFYLFGKSQMILGNLMGLRSLPGFPYLFQQTTGGWLGLFVIALWLTRKHLKNVFIQSLGIRPKNSADSFGKSDITSYRMALIGFILGLSFLILFCVFGGMSFWVAIPFFILLVALETTIARMRAELGPPVHEMELVGPDSILVTLLGTRRLGGRNLTMLSYLYFTDRTVSNHPIPHMLEAFKMSKLLNIDSKKLALTMMTALVVGVISGFWALLHSAYRSGVESGFTAYTGIGWEAIYRLAWWVQEPRGTNYPELGFIGIGLFFSLIMMFLRIRFLWWPLHPVGYAISTSGWIINYIWFSFMVSWFIKWIILKYGGIKMYRSAIPFFLGLILGEYTVGCLWNLLGIILGFKTYGFFES
jgi:hypothetical protein